MLMAGLLWTGLACGRDDSLEARDSVFVLPGDGVDVLWLLSGAHVGALVAQLAGFERPEPGNANTDSAKRAS
jgi:hypothetical protein